MRFLLAVLLTLATTVSHADVRFGSWNIRHLGWNNDKAYSVVAATLSEFDLAAVQEVMEPGAVEQLELLLEEMTGESWSHLVSHELGRGRYREHYAFLWRDSEVRYVDGAVVYLDRRDVFLREPFSARFEDLGTGNTLAVGTVHIVFGDAVADRVGEIEALADYWLWLSEVYPEERDRLLLAGDFNLPPDHSAWDSLKELALPVILQGGTTLSPIEGRYASLYDNIWIPKSSALDIQGKGIMKLPGYIETVTGLTWSHKKLRDQVSDHVPVYALLGTGSFQPDTGMSVHLADLGETGASDGNARDCVDINAAAAAALQAIPYIGDQRAVSIINGRPWGSVAELTQIKGIGKATLKNIQESGVVCPL